MEVNFNFEVCTCIKQFTFVARNNKHCFFKNKTYTYSKSFYHDTDMIIYEVYISSDISLPMLENKFTQNFETLQHKRNRILTEILNQDLHK
jgi:hypothetical protein